MNSKEIQHLKDVLFYSLVFDKSKSMAEKIAIVVDDFFNALLMSCVMFLLGVSFGASIGFDALLNNRQAQYFLIGFIPLVAIFQNMIIKIVKELDR